MSVLWLFFAVFLLAGSAAFASTVAISDATQARAYVDRIFTQNNCRVSFAQIDAQMRIDGIIPTEAEMQSDVGVAKFIRQRRVMGALEMLFETGDLCPDTTDTTFSISKFGGCA